MQINFNEMFNYGILLNGVLIPRLDKNLSGSCSFINLDYYCHIQHILTIFKHF